jgi:F420H(2)-dependent quinone reductase
LNTPSKKTSTPPPRAFLRAFWATHKAIVRLTGGRIGLWRPRPGKRFGVLGLETLGRRSGQRRLVLVGYFEDGDNLATLAMNGWADAEPAWWINLQAEPDATVLLRTGRRPVRAHAAVGEDRERLWAKVADYPGWGNDVDDLAAQRSKNTAVVLFEPRITR